MVLFLGHKFCLHIRYKKWHGIVKTKHEDVVFDVDDMFRECSAGDKRGETIGRLKVAA
jgi:hypothetical protein